MKKKAPPVVKFEPPLKIIKFVPRFVPERCLAALSNMWHLSRVPHGSDRHKRLCWTADEFAKENPDLKLSSTAVYKDLCNMVEGY